MPWCLILLVVGLVLGCTQEAPPPPVPPPPEDLSTWTVPEAHTAAAAGTGPDPIGAPGQSDGD